MKFRTNLKKTNENSFDLIPPGKYIAEIIEVDPETASTGTQFLNIDFRILGPTHSGRHVWARLFLTEKAGWKLAALLNALDLSLADELETETFFDKNLTIIVVVEEDDQGVKRNGIRTFKRIKLPLTEAPTI